ncbi:DNA-directed RNA polymerase, subunit A, partial [mine drainage metagenome]
MNEEWLDIMVDKKENFRIAPGEAVGTIAAQSIGEPSTQMVLQNFHQAGVVSAIRTKGLPRLIELIDARKVPKVATIEIWPDKSIMKDLDKTKALKKKIEEVLVKNVISGFDENFNSASMRLTLNKEKLAMYDITERNIVSRLEKAEGIEASLDDHVITVKVKKTKNAERSVHMIRVMFVKIRNMTIAGVKGISSVGIETTEDGAFYLIAMGNNISGVLDVDGVDNNRVYSNDPFEVMRVFGIEAARNLIANELKDTMKVNGVDVSYRHLALVADAMTFYGGIKSVGRHGIAGSKNSVFARAAYEETIKHFTNACVFSESDPLTGVAENILIGKQVKVGTGIVK